MLINQGLLKRNPSLTPEEFSKSWYERHAALVVPFFLHSGVTYYAQVHAPLSTSDTTLDLSTWDGAAEMRSEDVQKIFSPSAPTPQWKTDYYTEVILKDEKRLLVSLATEHLVQVGEGTVSGNRKVVIEGGKSLINVSEEILGVWREYEKRGEEAKQ